MCFRKSRIRHALALMEMFRHLRQTNKVQNCRWSDPGCAESVGSHQPDLPAPALTSAFCSCGVRDWSCETPCPRDTFMFQYDAPTKDLGRPSCKQNRVEASGCKGSHGKPATGPFGCSVAWRPDLHERGKGELFALVLQM